MSSILLPDGFCILIDDDDLDLISHHTWHPYVTPRSTYAYSSIAGKRVYLHRLLMQPPAGLEVDHRNGDGLDNRRTNLRIVTRTQNQRTQRLSRANTSGYRGVSYDKKCGRWHAYIKHHGKVIHLGFYATVDEAAAARARKEAELWSE